MGSRTRFIIVKDYYTENGDNCTDTWCILYSTQAEAEAVMASLNVGQDRTWFDPSDPNSFLYVDQIEL